MNSKTEENNNFETEKRTQPLGLRKQENNLKTCRCRTCGKPLGEHGVCWGCQARSEDKYYSNLYRCSSRTCNAIDSQLIAIDGDEDFVELRCRWCGQEFKIDLPYNEPEYNVPTHEDDQRMVDEYHIRKYGEC